MDISALEEFAASFGRKNGITVKTPVNNLTTLQDKREYITNRGLCEKTVLPFEHMIELSEWFLVWYTLNDKGETGYDKTGSNNYTVAGFAEDYSQKKLNVPAYKDRIGQLEGIIKELRCGLNQSITITVAYHNELKKNLVVDGVKRTIALYYLKLTDSKSLEKIMSDYPVYILRFSSNKGEEVFPCDFQKLMNSSPTPYFLTFC